MILRCKICFMKDTIVIGGGTGYLNGQLSICPMCGAFDCDDVIDYEEDDEEEI